MENVDHTLELSQEINHEMKLFTSIMEKNYKRVKRPHFIYFLSKVIPDSEENDCLLKIDIYVDDEVDEFKYFNDSVVVWFTSK